MDICFALLFLFILHDTVIQTKAYYLLSCFVALIFFSLCLLSQEHLLKITSEHRAEMAIKRGKLNLPEEGRYFVIWLPLPIDVFLFT